MAIASRRLQGYFYVEQDPHPFLRSVQQVKVRDTVQFRRDGAILENFPDETSLSVNYRPIPGNLYSGITVPCKPFDVGALKFIAVWKNKSRSLTAQEQVLAVERHDPEPLCEDKCADWWTYVLRIESKDVPLTDDLLLTIDAADGTHVAKLTGGLGPLEYPVNPAPLP